MIEYRNVNETTRVYKYKGKEHSLKSLSKLPECTVHISTLCSRLTYGINKGSKTKWRTVEQCVITPSLKHTSSIMIRKTEPNDDSNPDNDWFFNMLKLIPPGSLRSQALIIGSK